MANLIQIKRSTLTDAPSAGGLTTGELAYSLLSTSNSLFVGDGSNNPIRIGGGKYLWLHQANVSAPGTLTANAVVVTNGNSFVTGWKTNSLTVGVDGATVAISNISTAANSTQLGGSAGGANTELASTWAIKTYIDGQVAASIPVLTSGYIGFGNSSNYLGGVSTFKFDSVGNILTVGNATVNSTVSQTQITTAQVNVGANVIINTTAVFVGNSTVNTVINGGTASITGNVSVGNSTVNAYVTPTYITVANAGGQANITPLGLFVGSSVVNTTVIAAGANVYANTTALFTGNATVNSVITEASLTLSSDTANIAVGNATVKVTSSGGNLNVTGQTNTGTLYVVGNAAIAGNLTITGTLTTVNANNIVVQDSMIELASNNTVNDVLDIGLFGRYESGTAPEEYTGFFRDASDGGVWKLFSGLSQAPTTTVDTANASFTFSTLQTYIKSGGAGLTGFISNSSTIAITANSTLNVAIVANTLTLSSPLVGTSGGTGLSSFTAQDILVANSSNGFSKLAVGSEGYVLQVSSGAVAYGTLDGGTF